MQLTSGPKARRNNTRNAAPRLDTGRSESQAIGAIGLKTPTAEKARAAAKCKANTIDWQKDVPATPPMGNARKQQKDKVEQQKKTRKQVETSNPDHDPKQHKIDGTMDKVGLGPEDAWLREVGRMLLLQQVDESPP